MFYLLRESELRAWHKLMPGRPLLPRDGEGFAAFPTQPAERTTVQQVAVEYPDPLIDTLRAAARQLIGSRPGWRGTRRISYGIRIDELSAPEAAGGMVIDDTDGLHPGIDDRWPDELEAAPFHLLGDPLRQR